MCQDTLASEPQNAELAISILTKLSGVVSSEIPIGEQFRTRKTLEEMPNKVLATPEPDPFEAKTETPVLIEEQVQEPQSLPVSDNSELNQKESEQIGTLVNKPKPNLLQHLLQKIRPTFRQYGNH